MPIPVRREILRQLAILAEYPTLLSEPSHFPYREKCQIFPYDLDHDDMRWELRTLFQYGQDEQTIHVLMVCHSKLPIEEAERRDPPPLK
jgi:hypothetical protein